VYEKIKVLVVDDSSYVVATVSKKLESDPGIEVIGSAHNGLEAVEKVKALKPDVVTLDVVMPEMDGLTALEHIMSEYPTPVIMLSALTNESAESTLRALELGAVDFFLKPSVVNPAGNGKDTATLIEKVKIAAKVKILIKKLRAQAAAGNVEKPKSSAGKESILRKVVVIGSSTGGPRALMQVIPRLPADLPAAVLVVQHMPPVFTRTLAERLGQVSKMEVREAQPGESLKCGQVLVAPGDYHMELSDEGKISLNQSPTVMGVRPSVDVTMKSVARIYKSATIGVILTGMGSDGTLGASHIKAQGGKVLAEDQSTCTIYGMPMSVIKAGYADRVVPLPEMASEIVKECMESVAV